MNIQQDIRPVTYLKNNAAHLLAQINKTHRPVIITQKGKPMGVLQAPEGYERMRRAIGILKLVAQGEDDIQAGRMVAQDQVFKNLKEKLRAKV